MTHRLKVQGERVLPLVLPQAPEEYDREFMSEIIRMINTWARGLENPGPVRASYLFCDDAFPRNGNHLEEGSVYIDNDTLKVVLALSGYAPSFGMTMSLGSVTTTIA